MYGTFLLQFVEQKNWIAKNFPKDRRYESLIAKGENVLTADTFKYVSNLTDFCFIKVPMVLATDSVVSIYVYGYDGYGLVL